MKTRAFKTLSLTTIFLITILFFPDISNAGPLGAPRSMQDPRPQPMTFSEPMAAVTPQAEMPQAVTPQAETPQAINTGPTMQEYRDGCSKACGEQFSQQDPDIKGNRIVCYNDGPATQTKKSCTGFGSAGADSKWCITHNSFKSARNLGNFECIGLSESAAR